MKYGNITLKEINSTHIRVPKTALPVVMDDRIKTAIAIAYTANNPVLLRGETGTAKSSIIRELAYLLKQPYVRISINSHTDAQELIGRMAVKDGKTYFEDGIFTEAMKIGAMLVLDEVNMSNGGLTAALHSALDEDRQITLQDGTVIKAHPDFRVFGTMNPDYAGTQELNSAFKNRFLTILDIEVLSPEKEQALLVERTKITKANATNLVTIATMARKAYGENKISTFVSTRSLLAVGDYVTRGMDIHHALEVALVNQANDVQEKQALHDFCLAVLKYADAPDDLEQPIVTTKGVLKKLEEEAAAAADVKKVEAMQAENEILSRNLAASTKELKELQEKVESFKTLESTYKKLQEALQAASVS